MAASAVQSLSALAEHFPGLLDLAGRVAARTLTEYRRDLQLYLTFCEGQNTEPLDPQSLRGWCTQMAEHTQLSPNTINRRLAAIKRVVRATAMLGKLPMDIAHGFVLIERVQVSPLRARLHADIRIPRTPEQVKALIDTPDVRTLVGKRDRALLATYAASGCRVSEIVSLQSSNILPSGKGWLLRVLGKGQSEPRLAPLDRLGWEAIEDWLTARSPYVDVQAVFTAFSASAHGKPVARAITAKTAWRVMRKYAGAAGLPHMKPHDFRRFVGTQLAAKDLRAAQLALGHKRLETTARHYLTSED